MSLQSITNDNDWELREIKEELRETQEDRDGLISHY